MTSPPQDFRQEVAAACKVVRDIAGIGLADAVDVVKNGRPLNVHSVNAADAIAARLREFGATVEVKENP
jgi:ribosomal protein L7/L12